MMAAAVVDANVVACVDSLAVVIGRREQGGDRCAWSRRRLSVATAARLSMIYSAAAANAASDGVVGVTSGVSQRVRGLRILLPIPGAKYMFVKTPMPCVVIVRRP